MASSGITTFSVNELDIITDALEDATIIGAGETPSADDLKTCRRKLNMLVKQWSSLSDFSRGMKMWARKRAYLFLQNGQSIYSLGPTGDHAAANSYVTTTLTADSAGSDTTLDVESDAGISDDDFIGIVLDSGEIHWTQVNGTPAANVVTIDTGLASQASAGARVFAYTSKMRRPLNILTAMLRDTDNKEVPVDITTIIEEYESLPDKTVEGTPSFGYFEAQLTNAKLYLDRRPDDVTKVISMVYLSPIEDFTATTDTADFSQEWYRALVAQLAIDICPAFGKEAGPTLVRKRDEALLIAQRAYPEMIREFYQPNADGWA